MFADGYSYYNKIIKNIVIKPEDRDNNWRGEKEETLVKEAC